jgi:hypothetical protein
MAKLQHPLLTQLNLSALDIPEEIARSGDWTQLPQFYELVESIREIGQVEPAGAYLKNDGRLELIWGFRRYAALYSIQRESRQPQKILTLVFEDLTRADIIMLGLIGNSAEPLQYSDLAAGLHRLAKEYTKEYRPIVSDQFLAKSLGILPGMAYRLLRIARNAPLLLRHWQQHITPLSYSEVEAIAMNGSSDFEKCAEYDRLIDRLDQPDAQCSHAECDEGPVHFDAVSNSAWCIDHVGDLVSTLRATAAEQTDIVSKLSDRIVKVRKTPRPVCKICHFADGAHSPSCPDHVEEM